MTAQIIDGKRLAREIRDQIAERARAVGDRGGAVRLDAILVDAGDSAARVYAENQARTCRKVGIEYRLHELGSNASRDDIVGRVLLLNQAEDVHAIMVHLPLPGPVDPYEVQRLIDPAKDVEGVNPANIGNIVYGRSSLAPCTALATLKLVESTGIEIRGKRAVVVGASDVVGKPIAVMLMRQDATVVSCNIWTWGLEDLCRSADILIPAAGVPGLVKPDMVKPGAVLVDVGVSRVEGTDGENHTVGDACFEECREVAAWISPVPGGVGPMTVSMLLLNVVESAERRMGIKPR